MRRLFLAVLSLLLLALPVAAQDDPVPGAEFDVAGELIRAFNQYADSPELAPFIREGVEFPRGEDPAGDFEFSTGEPPGLEVPTVDIVQWKLSGFDGSWYEAGFFDPVEAGGLWCGGYDLGFAELGPAWTYCPPGFDPMAFSDGGVVSLLELGAPREMIGSGTVCEFFTWARVNSGAPVFEEFPQYPNDPAEKMNRAFGLRYAEMMGVGTRLDLDSPSTGFREVGTNTIVALGERALGIITPRAEMEGVEAVNFYTFCTDANRPFTAEGSVADQTGEILIDLGSLYEVPLVPATQLTTTTSTTTTTTPTTTSPAPTTTVAAPTTSVAAAPVAATGGFPWWVLIVGGLLLGGAGGLLMRNQGEKTPCAEELARWKQAQAECDRAKASAEQAQQELEEAVAERQQAEDALEQLREEWPPLNWDDGEGSWIELSGDPGSRITQRDLWLGRQYAADAWQQYRANPGPEAAKALEEAWKQGMTPEAREELREKDAEMQAKEAELEAKLAEAEAAEQRAKQAAEKARAEAEEACAAADAARRAYEECIGAASAGASSGGEEGGGTDPGPEDEPKEGQPCKKEDEAQRPPEVIERFGPRQVPVDFSLTVQSEGIRRSEEAEELAISLGQLGADLDFLGSMIGGVEAGLAGGAGRYGEAAAGVGTVMADIPTSPAQLATEILERTAKLGSTVAAAVGRWTKTHELYTIRSTIFVVTMEMVWQRRWVCEDGSWRCRVELVTRSSKLQRGRSVVESDLLFDEMRVRAARRSQSLEAHIRREMAEVHAFATKHQPGPCQ